MSHTSGQLASGRFVIVTLLKDAVEIQVGPTRDPFYHSLQLSANKKITVRTKDSVLDIIAHRPMLSERIRRAVIQLEQEWAVDDETSKYKTQDEAEVQKHIDRALYDDGPTHYGGSGGTMVRQDPPLAIPLWDAPDDEPNDAGPPYPLIGHHLEKSQ